MKKAIFVAVFCSVSALSAQDLIYLKKTDRLLKVKITAVSQDTISYKSWPEDDHSPVQLISRDNISRIVFEKGDKYDFQDDLSASSKAYQGQRRNAVKIGFLSPVFDHLSVSYERSMKPGRSFEFGAGWIGIGNRLTKEKSTGYFGRAAFRFTMLADDDNSGKQRYVHLMKGPYVKPELAAGSYKMGYPGYNREVIFGGALINVGYQWVFRNMLLLDSFFGLGYGFATYSNNTVTDGSYDEAGPEVYHYAFYGAHNEFPLVVSAGLKIGFLLGKPKIVSPSK